MSTTPKGGGFNDTRYEKREKKEQGNGDAGTARDLKTMWSKLYNDKKKAARQK